MQRETGILGAVTAAHAAVGAWIATAVPGPLLAVDDIAFLSMARTLAGEGAAPLGPQPPYGVAYPVLLAPGWLIGLDEAQMVTYGRLLNAVLGALLVPVLVAIVRRVTTTGFGPAVVASVVGASLPAALLTGSIVWTERLVPLLVALAVLALLRLEQSPTLGRSLAVSVVAVALYATHPRMLVVALVVGAIATWILAVAGRPLALAAGWVAARAGMVLAELARVALAEAAFGSSGTYGGADLAARRGLDDVPEMVLRGGGAVAYLVLATAGVAALGGFVMWNRRALATWYALLGVGVLAVAGWFLVGVDRADAYLHGRYVEVLAPLLVTLGILGARALPWRRSASIVATATVLAGLYAAWAGPGDNWARSRSPVMMLGVEVSGAPFGAQLFEPGAATSVALVVGVLVVLGARRSVALGATVAAPFLALAVWSGLDGLDDLHRSTTVGAVQEALADVEIDQLVIDTDRVPANLAAAVAWEVGLDRTTDEIGIGTTHLLVPADATPPAGATAVVELDGATVWAL